MYQQYMLLKTRKTILKFTLSPSVMSMSGSLENGFREHVKIIEEKGNP